MYPLLPPTPIGSTQDNMIQGAIPEANTFDLRDSPIKQSVCIRQKGMAKGKQAYKTNKTGCMACHEASAVR